MRRFLFVGLALSTALALTLIVSPPTSAHDPSDSSMKTYPTVMQTVEVLDCYTYKYTVNLTIPHDVDTDYTKARLFFITNPDDPPPYEAGECVCDFEGSTGYEDCYVTGNIPLTVSAKNTKRMKKVTCTLTAPSFALWESRLQIWKDFEYWVFPGLWGWPTSEYCQ